MSKKIHLDDKQLQHALRLYLLEKGIKPTSIVIQSASGPDFYGYCGGACLSAIYGEEAPNAYAPIILDVDKIRADAGKRLGRIDGGVIY